MSGSYKGDINFESVLEYEKSGTFEPATKEHAQRNTPKPKKPGSVTEKSLKGMRDTIAYTAATVEYAINTGDYSLIENGPMSTSEKNHFLDSEMKDLLQRARDGKRWVDNAKMIYTLDEDKPVWDGEVYSWKRTFTMNYGKFEVNDGKVEDVSDGGGDAKREFKGHLLAEYRNGSWVVAGIASQFEDDDDPVTPSSSPSASAGI